MNAKYEHIKVRLFKHGKLVKSFGMDKVIDNIIFKGDYYLINSRKKAESWDGYEVDYAFLNTIEDHCPRCGADIEGKAHCPRCFDRCEKCAYPLNFYGACWNCDQGES